MKRFWKEAAADPADGGFAIRLDARALTTPAKNPLVVPTRALADGIAAEWNAQDGDVDPASMPFTRAANTTIDRVIAARAKVAAEIARYGETDLLCYRAPRPLGLVVEQRERWDPVLDWAAAVLRVRLLLAEGVMHVPQPEESIATLRAEVEAHDAWELTALHDLVTISGSLVLGLAVSRGHLGPEDAWSLSRIDEEWNIREWGEDAEAAAVAVRRERDFANAARLLHLLRSA